MLFQNIFMRCKLCLHLKIRIIARLFLFLIALAFTIFFVFNKKDDIPKKLCINMPPHNFIHPVFLANGPKIQSQPKPVFKPQRVKISAKFDCNLQNKTLIIVNSHLNHTKFREMQRENFHPQWLSENNAVIYFIVGNGDSVEIKNEINRFNDIIQVDTIEHYHNITYKAIFWIKEIAKCKHGPKLLLKIDDDVHIDMIGLQFLIERYRVMDDFIACRVIPSGLVVRNDISKWYLSKEEYKFSTLGTYCQGMVYFISGNLMPILHRNIDKSQFLWMDDWYVTRSLVGDHKISYYSLEQHSLSPSTVNEVYSNLNTIKHRRWRTIFVHLRPPRKFPMYRRKRIWAQIMEVNNSCEILKKARMKTVVVY